MRKPKNLLVETAKRAIKLRNKESDMLSLMITKSQ